MRDCRNLIAPLTAVKRKTLIARIDTIPLFAHAYSHHLNMRLGGMAPGAMLDFAGRHHLSGLNIHVEDGEGASLQAMDERARRAFGEDAMRRGLILHVETSATDFDTLASAARIARDVSARSLRSYPRHAGRVSAIIRRTIEDFRALDRIDPAGGLKFTLEQHEDLKAAELVEIVETVNDPRLTLLFDFGNSVNAHERPEDALAIMTPHLTEAHIKDIAIGPDRGGWAQIARASGTGEVDFHRLLLTLLLIGEDRPQVTTFALQEENGMVSPAYRFPDEEADPEIPWRAPSTTDPEPGEALSERLGRERQDADAQVSHVRSVLADLRAAALMGQAG